jgi:hypothetical protein
MMDSLITVPVSKGKVLTVDAVLTSVGGGGTHLTLNSITVRVRYCYVYPLCVLPTRTYSE